MCRPRAVREWYPLWAGPGHESEDKDQNEACAARQRKHWAASPGRWQHHSQVVCPVSSWIARNDKKKQRRWRSAQGRGRQAGVPTGLGAQHILKGPRQPSAQRPSVQEQHVRVGARLRLAEAINPSRRRCTTEDPLLSSIKQLRCYLGPAKGANEMGR